MVMENGNFDEEIQRRIEICCHRLKVRVDCPLCSLAGDVQSFGFTKVTVGEGKVIAKDMWTE